MRFRTIVRREVSRFWKIKRQTLLAPLIETFLFISVFGAALGSRIQTLQGVPYVVYIIPGLIMMSFAMNAYGNNSSSIFQQRYTRAIDDQLASPISTLELVSAYAFGGFLRGFLIASVAFGTANLLLDLPLVHPFLFISSLFLIGAFFSILGVLLGVTADSFDRLGLYQSFIIQPLIFLGGVFYSVSLLPPVYQAITQFNPVFYMINTVRYGMLGKSDVDPFVSLAVLSVVTIGLFLVTLEVFRRGYKLRA